MIDFEIKEDVRESFKFFVGLEVTFTYSLRKLTLLKFYKRKLVTVRFIERIFFCRYRY